jgi:hypothetical protein
MAKRNVRSGWSPNMEQRADLDGRQVKCLIASEGHEWMRSYFDRLPKPIRHRLAQSRHNLCPACLSEEAQHRETTPSVETYLAVITEIERLLDKP